MYRAAIERPRTLRTWKAHNELVHNNVKTGCICDEQPGRFRKGERIAGRCGNRRCWMCYGIGDEKRMKIQRFRYIKEFERHKGQLEEIEYVPIIAVDF